MRLQIEQAIAAAKARSVQAYLRRQTIGSQQQALAGQAALSDQEIISLDGEIRGLEHALSLCPKEVPDAG